MACLVFGITATMIFTASAVYHFLSDGYAISPSLDRVLENLDHFAIYLFIAGTYSPFLLNVIAPPWKLILLISIWSVAVLGILYTHFRPKLPLWAQHRLIYTSLFVIMGWVLVIRLGEILTRLSTLACFLLVAGGVSYTLGALIYATRRPRLFPDFFGFHELWHIMVTAGFAFHYFLILNFYRGS